MGYFFFILDQLCLQHHSYGHNSHHRNRKNSHCQPHCDVLHSKCVRDYFGGTRKNSFSCRCLPGFAPTYLPANSILYSSQRRLVFCQPTMTNGTLQGSASAGGVLANNGLFAHNATVPFKYYPGKIDTISTWHAINDFESWYDIEGIHIYASKFFRRHASESLDAGDDWNWLCFYRFCWCLHLFDVVSHYQNRF